MEGIDAELANMGSDPPKDGLLPAASPSKGGGPSWTNNPPRNERLIYSVGTARGGTVNMSLTLAENRARTDLARQISAAVTKATVQGLEGTETIILSTSTITLTGSVLAAREIIDGTCYALVSYPKAMIRKQAINGVAYNDPIGYL